MKERVSRWMIDSGSVCAVRLSAPLCPRFPLYTLCRIEYTSQLVNSVLTTEELNYFETSQRRLCTLPV